jgi:Asp-tRNA(Asn)/Glu-tRNA(Gln) amidotransferase A subunit family amidase
MAVVENAPPLMDATMSPIERLDACRATIDAREQDVHAFVDLDLDAATQVARGLDTVPTDTQKQLHGITTAIKEIIDVQGMTCAWGSAAHAGRKATRDASLVTALKTAGANIVGTTVSTEYAIASAGPTRNPHNLGKTPGGSSSGSAAAVGAGMVELAVGTQTIGSIIRPALYCGASGLKLSYDAITPEGVMPLQPTLDHIGLFAKDWALMDRALDALGLFSPDSTPPARCFFVDTNARLSDAVIAARNTAIKRIEAQGFEIVQASALSAKRDDLETLARDLTNLGLLTHHVRDYENTPELWSDTAKHSLTAAQEFSKDQIDDMHAACAAARNAIGDVAGPGDIFLSDAIEDVAPDWSADKTGNNRLQGLWSVLGLPTAAWTTNFDRKTGLPVGVQVSAPMGSDRWLAQLMIKLNGD